MKRPSARAPRPRLRTAAEKAALAKLDARLSTILEGAKAPTDADPPRIHPPTLEEEIGAMRTTNLLDEFLVAHERRGSLRSLAVVERENAVRAEIDHRIPRRRA